MFRSLVTIIRPFCESSLKNAGYILGSQLCLQLVPVYILCSMVQLTCSVANFASVTRIANFQGMSEDT